MSKYFLCLLTTLSIHYNTVAQEYYGKLPGQKLDWAFFYIEENYVDSINNNKLADIAIQRIIEELDPYSSYQTKGEADAQLNKDNGVSPPKAGLSFYMINEKTPIITYINRGGPADLAGLKKGYTIESINGISSYGKSHMQINAMLDDTSTTMLHIEYSNNNNSIDTTTIIKKFVPWYSIYSHYMIDDKTGYIKLASFTKNTISEFDTAINEFNNSGIENLILDLRNNSGGVKDQAIALADEFLDGEKLISSTEGHNMVAEKYYATSKGKFLQGRLICLIDEYTASASELFISAIQEWDRGVLIGYPSFGKGLIQQSYKLGDGSTIRLTIGRYYTPIHRNIQKPIDDNWFKNMDTNIVNGTAMSTLPLADSAFSYTKNQRKILTGTSGIYPDIYYVNPPENRNFLNKYNARGHIYDFTTHYVHLNRKSILEKYTSVKLFINDESFIIELSKSLKSYLSEKQFDEVNEPNFGVPRHILDLIKSWIASQIWDDNAYYQLVNASDKTIEEALKTFYDGRYDQIIKSETH